MSQRYQVLMRRSLNLLNRLSVAASIMLVISTTLIKPLLKVELPFHYYTLFLMCLLAIFAIAVYFLTTFWLIDLCNQAPQLCDELYFFPTSPDLVFDLLSAPPILLHAFLAQVGLVPTWPTGVLLSSALFAVFWGFLPAFSRSF